MVTTEQYLSSLQNDKKNMINILKERNIDVNDADTFTQLTNKVSKIKYSPRFIKFDNCKLEDLSQEILQLDTSNMTSMYQMFQGASNLTELDLSEFNTTNVTTMNRMFDTCNKLVNVDVSNFNTSNVTEMQYMFYMCNNLTRLDLSSFDTSNVVNMSYMFFTCNNLQELNLSNMSFEKAENWSSMFTGVPTDCLITVKDETAKEFVLNAYSSLTNVVIKQE